jgi:hypothetical protein
MVLCLLQSVLRQSYFPGWRRLRLLDESGQRDQHVVMEAEQYAPPSRRLGNDERTFPKPISQRATHRQANRPAELHFGDITPDDPLVLAGQLVQPVPHRLATGGGFPENQRYGFNASNHSTAHCINFGTTWQDQNQRWLLQPINMDVGAAIQMHFSPLRDVLAGFEVEMRAACVPQTPAFSRDRDAN